MNTMIEISRRGVVLADARRRSTVLVDRAEYPIVEVGVAYSPIVQAVQSALVALGYDVGSTGADGKLGPRTAAAIAKYQKDHGMAPTGKIDDALKTALSSAGASAGTAAAEAAKTTAKTELLLPAMVFGVLVVVAGVAIWALNRKGV